MNLLPRDPAALSLHPLHAQLPAPDFKSEPWVSFRDNLQAAGPEAIPPVVITEDGQVMDGRRRWLAAQQLGWKTLRCEVRPAWQAPLLLAESLVGQRSMTLGAKVYLVRKVNPDYVRAAEQRRLANLKTGRTTREVELKVPTTRDEKDNDGAVQGGVSSNLTSEPVSRLCARLGCTRETWSRAGKVLALFATDAEAKARYEAQLLDGTKNLWNVLSGFEGEDATKGKERPTNSATQMEFFDDAMEPLLKAVAKWDRIKPDFQQIILTKWRDAVAQMPAEAREALAAILLETTQA